jgi:hypothetical protein
VYGAKCVVVLVGPTGRLDALEKGKIVCQLLGPEIVDRSVVAVHSTNRTPTVSDARYS